MNPLTSILDESFRYVPSAATSVADTWRRFGWRPTTDEERQTRRGPVTWPADEPATEAARIDSRVASPREKAFAVADGE